MRAVIALGLLVVSQPVVAQDGIAAHRPHYETAKSCISMGAFVGTITRDGPNDLPDNKAVGQKIVGRYMDILAFHGHHMDMTAAEIIADVKKSERTYIDSTIARLNKLTVRQQNAELAKIYAKAEDCGNLPSFRYESE